MPSVVYYDSCLSH